jgi:uncharacterized protein
MAYLIDGHNLIGYLSDLRLDQPDDEARLVQKLLGFSARTGKRIIVVFDHGLPGGKSRLSQGKVEVVFAARPGEADDVMLTRIKAVRDVQGWVVVSSDLRVIEAAKARGMRALRSADFAPLLVGAAGGVKQKRRKGSAEDEKPKSESPADIEAWLRAFGEGE